MGLGHVPPRPLRVLGPGRDVQGRQRRGAPGEGAVAIPRGPGPQAVGLAGEDLAAEWYRDRGYEVVARNWRCRDGELDLVARQGRSIVFCEVKARTTDRFGTAAEAVTYTKRARIRRLAARWLSEWDGPRAREIRFDVVAITAGTVDVLEGAF